MFFIFTVNNRPVKRLNADGSFFQIRWSETKVGDIVRLENNEYFPADLLLLSSSEPDAICYVETANLDGETNLKVKQGLPDTSHVLTPQAALKLSGLIRCERPNNSLYTFEGTWRMETNSEELALGPTQILLRGCQLRNTPWVYGMVLNTGRDTKLFRNSSPAPTKQTSVERVTNHQMIVLSIILVVMSLFCTTANLIWMRENASDGRMWYMRYTPENISSLSSSFGLNFLTFIILFVNLIPISLIVTLEIVKLNLAMLINNDLQLYHAESDTPARARTSNLIEELGTIHHIFSDKTGTLTENIMEFKKASVAGMQYCMDMTHDLQTGKFNAPVAATFSVDEAAVYSNGGGEYGGFGDFGGDANMEMRPLTAAGASSDSANFQRTEESFERLLARMQTREPNAKYIHEFLTLLAVCHTVIPEVNEETGDVHYQASSPDENALVQGAVALGYRFLVRRPKNITVDVLGQQCTYEILAVLEFNSTRKRMSVICRGPDGRIRLYCKGADTVILERLAPRQEFVAVTEEHLEDYAADGLRTLCLGYREVDQAEYDAWAVQHHKASTSLVDRDQMIMDSAELIEQNLFLLGATAIEDRLQAGVPETIQQLREANIKLWVLTGDRQETAINIGYSCRVLNDDSTLLVCNEPTMEACREYLEEQLQAVTAGKRTEQLAEGDSHRLELALIIDGKTLGFALEESLQPTFVSLAKECKAVICCRVSPLQKALVVKMARTHLNSITLAIGDGANDVSMIQAAHVGVGISGQEGLQAARAADFAIAQFRFLKRLLLVHGSWSYRRMSKTILYSLYKNIALYMVQFWFAFFNGYSGMILYEQWTISMYNVIFTFLPAIMLGVFDQFVSDKMLYNYPELYSYGQQQRSFNFRSFTAFVLEAFLHSLIIFFSLYFMFVGDLQLGNGLMAGHWFQGFLAYTMVVLTVTLKAALMIDYWPLHTQVTVWGSALAWVVFVPIYASLWPLFKYFSEAYGVHFQLYGSAVYWFTMPLIPLMCMLRPYAWKYYTRMYHPMPHVIVQEIQSYNLRDPRPGKKQAQLFTQRLRKIRVAQREKRSRGYAFSQNDGGQADLMKLYDTSVAKPTGL